VIKTNKRYIVSDEKGKPLESIVEKGRGGFLVKSLLKVKTAFSKSPNLFLICYKSLRLIIVQIVIVVGGVLDFDHLVRKAMELVAKNPETLLIATVDHETRRLSLIGESIEKGHIQRSFTINNQTLLTVPVFAYSPRSENFMGVYQKTKIYTKIMEYTLCFQIHFVLFPT